MNLDQVTVEIRPRSAWEALDLGLLMARRWWWPMMKLWLIVSLPVLAIALLIPAGYWWISAILIWWLKPIYERPLLHILSHAVFNELPDTHSTLKAFPSFAFKQIMLSLSWRRLSPTRCMDLPVLQLEGLSGARRYERLGILHREDSSPASWISFLGLMLEFSLWIGLITLVWAFIPQELNIEWAGLFFDHESAELIGLQIFIWYCAIALTAPFYVACGFALYLNRRIKLEAWDIDIAFRRIANKRVNQSRVLSLIGALAIGFCSLIDGIPPAYAEENLPGMEQASDDSTDEFVIEKPLGEYQELDRDSAQAAIKDVMQQSEFSRKEKVRELKFDEPEEDEDSSEFWEKLFDFLENFEGFIAAANMLEILLWLAVMTLIGYVIYRYRNWLAAQFVRVKPVAVTTAKPVTLFGMDVTRESLPDDISQTALELLTTGNTRAALALLYRASLFRLIDSGIEIHEGHTEGECVRLMREHYSTISSQPRDALKIRIDYFAQLTRAWQQLAYGHLDPDQHHAEQLCKNWNPCWLDSSTSTARGAQ